MTCDSELIQIDWCAVCARCCCCGVSEPVEGFFETLDFCLVTPDGATILLNQCVQLINPITTTPKLISCHNHALLVHSRVLPFHFLDVGCVRLHQLTLLPNLVVELHTCSV